MGFYGGPKGRDFRIDYVFSSYDEFVNAAGGTLPKDFKGFELGSHYSIDYGKISSDIVLTSGSYHGSIWQCRSIVEEGGEVRTPNLYVHNTAMMLIPINSGLIFTNITLSAGNASNY